MKIKTLFILIFLVFFSACAPSPLFSMPTPTKTPTPTPDAKAEYYRGIFDVCVQQTYKPDFCLKKARQLRDLQWYERPSDGWRWPLEEPARVNKIG